jgi:hypothetical protein
LQTQESYLSKNDGGGIEISGRITNCRAAAYLNYVLQAKQIIVKMMPDQEKNEL